MVNRASGYKILWVFGDNLNYIYKKEPHNELSLKLGSLEYNLRKAFDIL